MANCLKIALWAYHDDIIVTVERKIKTSGLPPLIFKKITVPNCVLCSIDFGE